MMFYTTFKLWHNFASANTHTAWWNSKPKLTSPATINNTRNRSTTVSPAPFAMQHSKRLLNEQSTLTRTRLLTLSTARGVTNRFLIIYLSLIITKSVRVLTSVSCVYGFSVLKKSCLTIKRQLRLSVCVKIYFAIRTITVSTSQIVCLTEVIQSSSFWKSKVT